MKLGTICLSLAAACCPLLAGESAGASDSALFGSIPVVEAATLHTQSLAEAPADVTVITAQDIRRYGYRTLQEALSGVRGFFSSSDRIYDYFGVRGFFVPGDYNTRFLVMINGHPMQDQVYSSNGFFAQDLGIDMDLVERIEVIRGANSALYGSNGMLANINIVTKAPVDFDKLRVSAEAGSYGEKKAILSSSIYLGRGLNLLLSESVFNDGGSSLTFPGVSLPQTGIDGQRGYHSFANLVWHNWTFTAYFNNRDKQPPLPWGLGALPFARGDMVRDSRNFVESIWTTAVKSGKLRWRAYYDQYRYDDRFYYPPVSSDTGVEDLRSLARGDSAGSELTWQKKLGGVGEFIAGVQLNYEFRNLQQDYTVAPQTEWFPAISHPDFTEGAFAQQEWKLSSKLSLHAGLRVDYSRISGTTPSPRAALVYQQSNKTTYKLVVGQSFRNPSAFERFYTDGGLAFLANPALRPERAITVDASAERRLTNGVTLIADVYDYHLINLIEATFDAAGVQQFLNFSDAQSRGVEFELNVKKEGWESNSSYSVGRTTIDGNSGPAGGPSQLAKFRAARPIANRRLWISTSFQFMSSRADINGVAMGLVALSDLTLSTAKLPAGCEFQTGIRNLAGWRYADPVTVSSPRMPADGRSFFVKLTWRLTQ